MSFTICNLLIHKFVFSFFWKDLTTCRLLLSVAPAGLILHAGSLTEWFVTSLASPLMALSPWWARSIRTCLKTGSFTLWSNLGDIWDPRAFVLWLSGPFVCWQGSTVTVGEQEWVCFADSQYSPHVLCTPQRHGPKCQPHHQEQINRKNYTTLYNCSLGLFRCTVCF